MTPDQVAARLTDAGRVLMALPTTAAITPEMRADWPEIISRAVDLFGGDRRWRALAPLSRAEVAPMAEALGWIRFVTARRSSGSCSCGL